MWRSRVTGGRRPVGAGRLNGIVTRRWQQAVRPCPGHASPQTFREVGRLGTAPPHVGTADISRGAWHLTAVGSGPPPLQGRGAGLACLVLQSVYKGSVTATEPAAQTLGVQQVLIPGTWRWAVGAMRSPRFPPCTIHAASHLQHTLLAGDVLREGVAEGVLFCRGVEPGDRLLGGTGMEAGQRFRGRSAFSQLGKKQAAASSNAGLALPGHPARCMHACIAAQLPKHQRFDAASAHLKSHSRHRHRPSIHRRPGVGAAAVHAACMQVLTIGCTVHAGRAASQYARHAWLGGSHNK